MDSSQATKSTATFCFHSPERLPEDQPGWGVPGLRHNIVDEYLSNTIYFEARIFTTANVDKPLGESKGLQRMLRVSGSQVEMKRI